MLVWKPWSSKPLVLFLRYDGLGRGFIRDASSPGSCPSDFLSTSPVAGTKAQAFIERAWTSSPTKVVALFIGSPFHECGVAAGGLDTTIVGLIRGYACRRGFQLFYVLLISSLHSRRPIARLVLQNTDVRLFRGVNRFRGCVRCELIISWRKSPPCVAICVAVLAPFAYHPLCRRVSLFPFGHEAA